MHALQRTTALERVVYQRMVERWLNGEYGPMRYWVSVPQHGLPVLLIHGYGSLIDYWGDVMPAVARSSTCYALDLYGFGYSAPLAAAPSRQVWSDQVADFIQRVIHRPVIVIGHSLGGVIAAQVASDYPHLVRGLVLINSTGLPNTSALYAWHERMFFQFICMPYIGEVLSIVFGGPLGVWRFLVVLYYRRDRIRREIISMLSGPLRQPQAGLFRLRVLRAYEELTLQLKPGDVTAPTLLLWGAQDRAFPLWVAHVLRQQMFPQAELAVIPESGHCPFDETPEAFCAILLRWIEELDSSGGTPP